MACEVSTHNFPSLLPRILSAADTCHFVAVDAEYTALNAEQACKSR